MNKRTPIRPLRILLIENHELLRKVLAGYLERFGHTVLCAAGVAEALQVLPEGPCEVLISNVHLSDGTGWDLFKQAKSKAPIFGIAMSSSASAGDREMSRAVGFRAHLKKPFEPKELARLLEQAAKEIVEVN